MKEAIVSRAYAQSFYELGKEQNVDVADELTRLNVTINSSNDLENVLFIDVFTVEEKEAVANAVMDKLGISTLSKNIVNFLLTEKRMGIFPLIFKELIVLDDHAKGFLRGVVEGREDSIDSEFLTNLKSYLKSKLGKEAELEYKKTDKITAGYRVTVEDLQLDASLDNQLNQLRNEILNS